MNLDPIATYLQTQGCGLLRKTIFTHEIPATCTEGILLLDAYHGSAVDPYLDGYYMTEFRVIVRSGDFTTGKALADKAFRAVKAPGGFTGEGMLVRLVRPLNMPRSYRRSVGAFWEFEIDVEIVFIDTST